MQLRLPSATQARLTTHHTEVHLAILRGAIRISIRVSLIRQVPLRLASVSKITCGLQIRCPFLPRLILILLILLVLIHTLPLTPVIPVIHLVLNHPLLLIPVIPVILLVLVIHLLLLIPDIPIILLVLVIHRLLLIPVVPVIPTVIRINLILRTIPVTPLPVTRLDILPVIQPIFRLPYQVHSEILILRILLEHTAQLDTAIILNNTSWRSRHRNRTYLDKRS